MAREKRSERAFINAEGKEVERMEQATGARYTLGSGTSENFAAVRSFDIQLGEAGSPATMYAVFGFHTKIGNVANTVLNDKDEPGTVEDAAASIEEFMASVGGGVWREAGEGGVRGPKYDNAILAEALVRVLGSAAKGDVGHYQARLDDPKGEVDSANKGYRAKVVAQDAVKAAYWQVAAEKGINKPATASPETLA